MVVERFEYIRDANHRQWHRLRAVHRSFERSERDHRPCCTAYHGVSGKPLWNSGKSMTTSAAPDSYWSGLSQVYVGSDDGTVYAFGFPDERR